MTKIDQDTLELLEDHFGDSAKVIWDAFVDHFGEGSSAQDCIDAYCGQYESEREYVEQYVDDLGMLDNIPDFVRNYFDYDAYARDVFINDLVMTDNGHVFYTSW